MQHHSFGQMTSSSAYCLFYARGDHTSSEWGATQRDEGFIPAHLAESIVADNAAIVKRAEEEATRSAIVIPDGPSGGSAARANTPEMNVREMCFFGAMLTHGLGTCWCFGTFLACLVMLTDVFHSNW